MNLDVEHPRRTVDDDGDGHARSPAARMRSRAVVKARRASTRSMAARYSSVARRSEIGRACAKASSNGALTCDVTTNGRGPTAPHAHRTSPDADTRQETLTIARSTP